MANKKLLICAALAVGLLLTACVKKEEPKNEEQQEQTTESQEIQKVEPEKAQQFEPLQSVETQESQAPVIEATREETPNTTTEIRREIRPAQPSGETAVPTEPLRTEQPKVTQPQDTKPAKVPFISFVLICLSVEDTFPI